MARSEILPSLRMCKLVYYHYIVRAFITWAHLVAILNQRHWQSLVGSMVRVLMGYLKS